MKTKRLAGTIVVMMLATTGFFTSASAQQSEGGRLYAFHTSPRGGCRGLDWHLVWTPGNNALNGPLCLSG